jgi:nitroreductase
LHLNDNLDKEEVSMDVLSVIKERRSINFFEPNIEIPDEKIMEVLEIANTAPSSFNMQPWEVIVVKSKEKKKILRNFAMNQPKVEEASCVFIIIANPLALETNMDMVFDKQIEYGYMKQEMKEVYKKVAFNLYGEKDSIKRIIFATKNASLFAMNLMITAKGMGFETHPMDGFDSECIKKEFEIEEYKIIPMIIAMGYKKRDINLLRRPFRRQISDFVTFR